MRHAGSNRSYVGAIGGLEADGGHKPHGSGSPRAIRGAKASSGRGTRDPPPYLTASPTTGYAAKLHPSTIEAQGRPCSSSPGQPATSITSQGPTADQTPPPGCAGSQARHARAHRTRRPSPGTPPRTRNPTHELSRQTQYLRSSALLSGRSRPQSPPYCPRQPRGDPIEDTPTAPSVGSLRPTRSDAQGGGCPASPSEALSSNALAVKPPWHRALPPRPRAPRAAVAPPASTGSSESAAFAPLSRPAPPPPPSDAAPAACLGSSKTTAAALDNPDRPSRQTASTSLALPRNR